jgi:hypothetical protein
MEEYTMAGYGCKYSCPNTVGPNYLHFNLNKLLWQKHNLDCHESIEQNQTNKQKNLAESGKNGRPLAPVRG